MKHYGLDPAHFHTSPELAWQACLKKTSVNLELLTDPNMLLMFVRGTRGGITQAVHRYAFLTIFTKTLSMMLRLGSTQVATAAAIPLPLE